MTRYGVGGLLTMVAAALFMGGLAAQLGVAQAEPKPILGAMLAGKPGETVTIFSVQKGFPAALGGLREGDEILALNDVELDDPAEMATIVREQGGEISMFRVRRDTEELFVAVKPWMTPDPGRDAELFPYAEDDEGAPTSALAARIDGRDYPLIERGGVFKLERFLGLEAPKGRVAFRARVETCDEIERLAGPIAQPTGDPMHRLTSVRSLLFDFDLARAERVACVAYMRKNDLSLSSPVVVIAGRFVEDAAAAYSSGGSMLLIDAVKFDHRHVTLGERLVSVFTLMGETGLLGE